MLNKIGFSLQFIIISTLLYIVYLSDYSCGPSNPTNVQDCLNDSDRQNVCCLATFYPIGNYSLGEKKRICVQTLANDTYDGKRSVISLNGKHNAIYDCIGSTNYDKITEPELLNNFFGVEYCSNGPYAQSEKECIDLSKPQLNDCCYFNGTINRYKETVSYSLCLKAGGIAFNSTSLANNYFSSSTNAKMTCVDPKNSSLLITINIGARSQYLTYNLLSIIIFLGLFLIF